MRACRVVVALSFVFAVTASADWVAPGDVWTGTSWVSSSAGNFPVGSVLLSNNSAPTIWTGQAWVSQATWMSPQYAGGSVWTGTSWVPDNPNTNTVGFIKFGANGSRMQWNGSGWASDPTWAGIQQINGKVWSSGKWVSVYRQAVAAAPARAAAVKGRGGPGANGQPNDPSLSGGATNGSNNSGGPGFTTTNSGALGGVPASSPSVVQSGNSGGGSSSGGSSSSPSSAGQAPGALVAVPSSSGTGYGGSTGSGNAGGAAPGTGAAPAAGGNFSSGGGGAAISSATSNPALGTAAINPTGMVNQPPSSSTGSSGSGSSMVLLRDGISDVPIASIGGGRILGNDNNIRIPAGELSNLNNTTFATDTLLTGSHVYSASVGGTDPVSVQTVSGQSIGVVTPAVETLNTNTTINPAIESVANTTATTTFRAPVTTTIGTTSVVDDTAATTATTATTGTATTFTGAAAARSVTTGATWSQGTTLDHTTVDSTALDSSARAPAAGTAATY